MSKISELGPITGANTRTEDLFVIVNLIQGDDGTKNITRKELVAAIQYEIFDRITITGGSISNVIMFNSTLNDVTINSSDFNNGNIDNSTITGSTIDESDFSNGTGNNNVFTNTIIDQSQILNSTANNMQITNSDFSDGTGNNVILTNSQIDDSLYNNVTIEGGTANNLILTNITIDELILEDAFISNSEIVTTSFSNGTIFDTEISNSTIINTDLDDVDITNSRFSNGEIWNTSVSNSTIVNTSLDGVSITDSLFTNGSVLNTQIANSQIDETAITGSTFEDGTILNTSANNMTISSSDFSNGTGNNNVFTNTTIDQGTITNSTLANSAFQGTMSDVVAENMQISSSTADGLAQTRSTFDGGLITDSDIQESRISNTIIEDSSLVDFDMDLKKVFEAPIDEDSYFALKNVKTGETEKMTYRQLYEEVSRSTEKALKVHVASDGDDRNDGTILKPVRTLKRAEQIALEKAGGSYDRNDLNNAVHISVGPGTYYVDEPIALPDDCSMTSTGGQYATVIQKKPGWERTNGVLVGSGCYVQGFSYMNFEVDNFDQPEGGFAIAYRPGALLRRSPYIRDSTQLSNFNRLDVEPPLNPFNSKGTILDLGQEFYLEPGHSAQALFEVDDEVTFSSGASGYISYVDDIDSNRQIYVRNLKGNVNPGDMLYAQRGGVATVQSIGIDDFPNRLVGRGGGCVLCDRALLDTDSLFTYLLCFGFTPRTQNGTGYVAKNGAGINGIGSLSIFTRQAFFALDGGQMTLNNSGSQFGDISMRARGSTVIIRPAEANQNNLLSNTSFADSIAASKEEIIDDMIEYLTSNTVSGGLGYQGYNADKCFRDTGIIVDNTGYDVATKGNYWGRLNGITYRSPISYVVVNEQLTETVGSIEHLKESINFIFENSDQEVRDRVDVSLNETLNVLQNGEEFANNIIFTDTGNGPATAARELVQDNREFIIEEFIDWLDNNEDFYAYDSTKCKRDVREFILPAVKYDTMLDTNYNSVTAGNAYYFKAAKNVIGAQREETIAAYERLRKTTDEIVEPISSRFAVEAYEKFNEIINILKMEGDKFTPTAATYEPTTGVFVMTIPAHGLEVGRYILLSPESFTFTCATDGNVLEFKHPRRTDPAFKSALPIIATTTNTITVNVGSTGYNGVHTLTEVATDAVIVLGSAIEFSDNVAIDEDRRNARKQLQANREFIQNYMMDWADNEWFFYDSKKCQRDMKNYIVPAVLRDMQTGTNFNSIQSGIAYRSGIARVAVNEQLTETIGAIDFLRQETANTVTDPVVIQRIDDGFNEIINIARNNSKKYTPTNATYDPVTGIMVATIGSHDFQLGDTIIIEKEGITFSCLDGSNTAIQISHPRETDPVFNTAIPILEKTSTTITVNVGNAGGYTGAHTFVSATTNAIREADIYDGKFTPLDADYDPISGDMTLTIGQHNLPVGKWISIADNAITFSCANTSANTTVEISHPRATDPAFRQPVRITAVSNTEITVNVGNANGYTGAHTFVSATVDCIDTNAIYWTDPAKIDSFHTPSTATYNPATGEMVITLGSGHGFTTDDHIEFKPNSVVFSCANTSANTTVEISHPRIGEPNHQMPLEITAVSNTTITVNPGAVPGGYTGVHTFVSAEEGAVVKMPAGVTRQGRNAAIKLQENRTFLQDEVDAWIRDNYFVYKEDLCARDTGLILDAVRRDMATGSNINSVFAGLAYRSGNASATEVVTSQLTETVGAITWLKGEVQDITSGTGQARADAAFDEIIDIMQNGTAAANTIVFGTSYVSENALRAKEALQANKAFLQAEVTSWISNTHPTLVYDIADCERDLGYFIDAISWDVQHGSNAATLKNARLYFDNAVGVLADDEKPVTAEAYKHIGKLAGMIVREEAVTPESLLTQTFNASNNALTPTTASYDPVTGVMIVTIPAHGLEVGEYVVIEEESITFSCPDGANTVNISHPRETDPYFNTPIHIDAVTTNTITLQVGSAGGYTGVHTFVSADAGSIRPSVSPVVAQEVVNLFEAIGNIVLEDNFVETFTNAGYGTGIPQIKEPTLVGTGYDAGINAQYERISGNTVKYQREIIDFIREEYNGLGFDTDLCYRDTGLIVDAITEDMEYGGDGAATNAASFYFKNAVSILPYDQREPTRLAFEHLADVIEDVVRGTTVTPTTGNTTTQITTGLTADAATGLRAKALTNIISSTVDNRLVIPDYTGSLDETQKIPEALPSANTELLPAIEPSRTFARKSLQKNKAFIQDEVVAFINDKYFVYNEDKCARDAAYILDAVRRDVQTGADYNAKIAGKAYRSGTVGSNVVINDQLAETVEAIKFIKRDVEAILTGTALTRATASFDNLINAMVDDYNTDTVNYNFGTATISTDATNARTGLQLNRDFLKAEAIAYINVNYPSLVYNAAKCSRDIGIMVDAISYDITHGSNVAIRDVSRLYFENGNPVLPSDQRIPTADVFNRIAAVAELALLKQPITKSAGNALNPETTFGTVSPAAAQTAQNLFEILADVISANSLVNMPAAVEATSTVAGATGYSYDAEAALIAGRKSSIQATINAYLQDTFDYLEYNQVKCRRDVGYMVDAISHDIQYGGNAAMWNAAQIYFVNMTNLLPLDQRDATREAFTRMANVIHDVIRNEVVVKSPENSSVQDTSNLTARREIAAEAKALGLMVANIADDNNPDNLPSRFEPENRNWMPAIFITEKNKVDDALETLVRSMINFISTEYNGISYPKEKCRRDVGIIVDALSHDVQYRTNYATRLCANMYFDNATSVLPFDQRIQTADFYVTMAELVKDVVQELATGQNTSNGAATAVEGEWVADMIRIIEEAIRRDSLDALPELIEPDTSWVAAAEIAAGEAIDAQLNELGDDVTQFLKDNFTIVDYSKAKCRRDSGYILDAMSWDLNYGGNIASRWNADFYYWNNQLRIPENTREATAKSYRKLGEIVSKVVTGSYPGQLLRPELGSEAQATQAYDLGLIFYKALFFNTPKALGPTIEPNFAWEEDQQFRFAKNILANNKTKLQREVQRFITSEYKFIDLPKTYRDAGNFLITLQNDIKDASGRPGGYNLPGGAVSEGSDRATRSFVGALFNINAQHVFPVFNPPSSFADWRRLRFKGTVENATVRNALTGMKRWDSYIIPINNSGNRYIGEIWYWTGTTWASAGQNNTDLLQSFVGAWERIRDYINNNVATQTAQRTMITELVDNVLIDSIIRPNFLVFGSLVESIAHQFNGASAGVNRNALPLNFRNVGAAIGANASVLSENGGRIRWSGSDELNNQYFARGLKINGRTGRIEGRPFTSSVRKLARRASNSRASL